MLRESSSHEMRKLKRRTNKFLMISHRKIALSTSKEHELALGALSCHSQVLLSSVTFLSVTLLCHKWNQGTWVRSECSLVSPSSTNLWCHPLVSISLNQHLFQSPSICIIKHQSILISNKQCSKYQKLAQMCSTSSKLHKVANYITERAPVRANKWHQLHRYCLKVVKVMVHHNFNGSCQMFSLTQDI